METSAGPKQNVDRNDTLAERRSLWPWFVTGFAAVFVGMSLAIPMLSMAPSGRGLVRCPLWRYYIIEARRAMSPSRGLGPDRDSTSVAIVTAFLHVLCSSIGGVTAVGIAWFVGRLDARRRVAP
jgi:hypothetical protein